MEQDPKIQALKAALWSGLPATDLDPAAVEAWVQAHQAVIQELKQRWATLLADDPVPLERLAELITVLQWIHQGNQDPSSLSLLGRELLAEADAELADIQMLLRRALLEWIGSSLGG
jgi:hypothetical protein